MAETRAEAIISPLARGLRVPSRARAEDAGRAYRRQYAYRRHTAHTVANTPTNTIDLPYVQRLRANCVLGEPLEPTTMYRPSSKAIVICEGRACGVTSHVWCVVVASDTLCEAWDVALYCIVYSPHVITPAQLYALLNYGAPNLR